jgi:hypothetical protein
MLRVARIDHPAIIDPHFEGVMTAVTRRSTINGAIAPESHYGQG